MYLKFLLLFISSLLIGIVVSQPFKHNSNVTRLTNRQLFDISQFKFNLTETGPSQIGPGGKQNQLHLVKQKKMKFL